MSLFFIVRESLHTYYLLSYRGNKKKSIIQLTIIQCKQRNTRTLLPCNVAVVVLR
jgi:hypothetical protein